MQSLLLRDRQIALTGEQRQLFPALNERRDASLLDAGGKGIIAAPALLAFTRIGDARRSALQDQGAKETRERCIERDAPTHRVAQQNSLACLHAQLSQHGKYIVLAMLHPIALGILRRR